MKQFLLELHSLHNFSLQKKVALFKAKFGHSISFTRLNSFYKRHEVKNGKAQKVFNRAISIKIDLIYSAEPSQFDCACCKNKTAG